MKPVIISAALLLLSTGFAAAQATGNHATSAPAVSNHSRSLTAKNENKPSSVDSLDQTKIYHWSDGQSATTTGHEAASINGGYAAIGRNAEPQKATGDRKL